MTIELNKYREPIRIDVNGELGMLIGTTLDGKFGAVDFGNDDIRYIEMNSNAEIAHNRVN